MLSSESLCFQACMLYSNHKCEIPSCTERWYMSPQTLVWDSFMHWEVVYVTPNTAVRFLHVLRGGICHPKHCCEIPSIPSDGICHPNTAVRFLDMVVYVTPNTGVRFLHVLNYCICHPKHCCEIPSIPSDGICHPKHCCEIPAYGGICHPKHCCEIPSCTERWYMSPQTLLWDSFNT